MKIAFIATYPPEQCGIATFTQNLLNAIAGSSDSEHHSIHVIAIQKEDLLEYPEEVSLVIRQHVQEDYAEAAAWINNSGTDFCIIQHEYGIFGGESGVYALSLANALNVPFVVTAHTVLKHPTVQQKSIMKSLADRGEQVIVMSNKARQFLRDIYSIDAGKITIIEHGVPKKISIEKDKAKEEFDLGGRTVLMTFGLLGRNKGIETVIRALPEVIGKHSDLVYLVQGNTHPGVLRHEGEAYRNSLMDLAKELGVSDHVIFRKGFMTEEKLFELLHSVDIYITPYLNEEQITSGTLSYALGSGAVVLSTPYWHAQELLGGNRGWLFNFKDHEQLAAMINSLLDQPETMEKLHSNALAYSHHLRWSNVGRRYVQLLKNLLKMRELKVSNHKGPFFKEPGLRHLKKLTDSIGIYQHALFGLPNYHEGYCLDDNARALLAMTFAADQGFENETEELAEVYLSFIHFMQDQNGWFHNFLSFERKIIDEECSEDAYGRTMWALGRLISSESFSALHLPAEEIFFRALKHARGLKYIRGIANTVIGLRHLLDKYPFHHETHELLDLLTKKMIGFYADNHNGSWNWFEDVLTYDNGILPLALLHAHAVTGDPESLSVAKATAEFLESELMGKSYLSLVGSNGWYARGGRKCSYPQQAIDAMSMVLLFSELMQQTGDTHYFNCAEKCYRWFFFENDLGISLYDRETQGCRDGLEDYGINRNQGAESTLAAFISHYAIRSLRPGEAFSDHEVNDLRNR